MCAQCGRPLGRLRSRFNLSFKFQISWVSLILAVDVKVVTHSVHMTYSPHTQQTINVHICFAPLKCSCAIWEPLGGLFNFAHLHLYLLIAALPLCISSYRFEFWVPIELHLLGMHIIILSLNGVLPRYNTILAYVLHELSKEQLPMLLRLCAPALLLYCMYAYITYTRTQLR